ncbi:NAD-glutamate dehydrogenase [Oleiphilus sp. HI0132]|uniref:NAD-glutamate dehydrogenase n=1 Tax=Oleiphilus sp. HI0132 TaxID=1822270 RepID=UPI0007C27B49|nr:NAD-glutamate dehydrogenase [Oleiphilus sp. HI0132]KZZ79668.1 NAD-glutamate dehydrogenase [Oleiphilus sp. HI0132]
MKVIDTTSKKKFISQIKDSVKDKLGVKQGALVTQFVDQLFASTFIEEFEDRRVSDMLGLVMSAWKFSSTHKGTKAKIEVFNPNLEDHNWQSPHTVLVVLQENMPFIVDSIRLILSNRMVKIHSIQYANIRCERAKNGDIESLKSGAAAKESTCNDEALIFIEIDRHSDSASQKSLLKAINEVMSDVSTMVGDYENMLTKKQSLIENLTEKNYKTIAPEDIEEGREFLRWMGDERFIFLGCVDYDLKKEGRSESFDLVKGSGLGLVHRFVDFIEKSELNKLPKASKQQIFGSNLFFFSKASQRSSVHRPVYPECVGVKRFDKDGNLAGICCFIGLYTAKMYSESPANIPLLRNKISYVSENSGLNIRDYRGKELLQSLIVFPREDLFQIDKDELLDVIMGTLYIQERKQTRLFIREDIFSQFVSCLAYVPREIYSTDIRLKIQRILQDSLGAADTDFNTFISESVLARTHINLRVEHFDRSAFNVADIEEKIVAVAQSWEDDLEQSLFDAYGEEKANTYINRYRSAFSSSYREEFSPRRAAVDIENIEKVKTENTIGMSFYRTIEENEKVVHFKLFHADQPIPLSDVMPIFENMGLRVIGENPYESIDREGATVWLHDFMLTTSDQKPIDISKIRDNFEELFIKVWQGDAENDRFNRLIISAYMNWRQIAMLRSYSRYMQQIRVSNSQEFISNTVVSNVEITALLSDYFEHRFKPGANALSAKNLKLLDKIEENFYKALNNVHNLTEDKILRLYLDLIKATMRTNFYQHDSGGADKSYISYKLQPRLIPNVPLPVPMYEIFVYSPRVEGVHLRGGKVARGGLRWSDRYEDYRTEVLGLVKAQQVKNAVIVPVGAKGGFVAKNFPSDRKGFIAEGIACYQTFITGMLNVTDNLVNGEVVKPTEVVCHDDDDYYLVVAADKGTATFSDIANEISLEKGHWLGDAFASGGSHGYDHKKMGITAKGAWVSVQRHFRELGLNTQTTPFTAIGIGDMAGDVFGNGMLLSKHTKLVAAFNHMHIFFDPDPDPSTSFSERKRLFELQGSTWDDYNKELISEGGGIYSRSSKSIELSKQMQDFIGTKETRLAPNDLINRILKAEVDLLWFGGIGTYIMSSKETHADVGDKANDVLRITGKELKAKVVGEGGNLGMTQLSRIEYAQSGGQLNTDFIDNAAGVDCSDHEVNIKILLNDILLNGDLTEKQRNKLLADMTDSVSDLVLKNNYRQTQAISIALKDAMPRMEEYRRLINAMEASGKLNRELEFLPCDDDITERKSLDMGLTRPELSVLISYVKGDLKEELINSNLPDDDHLSDEIEVAFPQQIVKKYGAQLHDHRLRREIISTQVANDMVNHMGITFVERLKQSTGASSSSVALAYIIARDVFDLENIWGQVEDLDYLISSDLQYSMMAELMSLMRRACRWLIRNRRSELNVTENMDRFKTGIAKIAKSLPSYLTGASAQLWQDKFDSLVEQGVPEKLAGIVAGASHLYSALGIIEAQEEGDGSLDQVAKIYYLLGNRLELTWFSYQINALTPLTHWQALAREAFREDLDWQQRALTVGLLKLNDAPKDINKRVDLWMEQHDELVARWRQMLTEFKATEDAEFSMYSVALRELLDLAQSTVHSASQAS